MNDWKAIKGYKYPYRINEEAVVEELLDGVWRTVRPFVQQDGRRAPRLCVRLVNNADHPTLIPVKRLMINAFFGGSKDGVSYGLRNGCFGDCSLANIYPLTEEDRRKQRKAYRKYRKENAEK